MKRLVLILMLLSVLPTFARRKLTGPQRVESVRVAAAPVYDTVPTPAGTLRFSGYDKPASALRETFFVSNRDTVDIEGFAVEITYTDLKDRQLHRQTYEVRQTVPAGETRAVSVASWDRNRAFRYHLSPASGKPTTPFRVKARALWLLRLR